MLDKQTIGIIALVRSAITGNSVKLPEDFDLAKAISIAKEHQILNMICYGACNSGISQDTPAMQKLMKYTYNGLIQSEQQLKELNGIFKAFDDNGIDYMPLKGALLKYWYPETDMRTMGDADILIKLEQYDKIKPLISSLGFTEYRESDHELIWKNDYLFLELHKRLIPSYNKDFYAYFGDGWRFAHPTPSSQNRFELNDEDQLLYLFTHFAKHYRDGGIGIKYMADLWLYTQLKQNLNTDYLQKGLTQLHLLEFYNNIFQVLDVWFKGEKSTDLTDYITQVIFDSGVYGNEDNHIASEALVSSKTEGNAFVLRLKRVVSIVFLPLDAMKSKYKLLNSFPFLLPVFWVVRVFQTLFFHKNRFKNNIETLQKINDDNIRDYQNSLNYVGLDYYFNVK